MMNSFKKQPSGLGNLTRAIVGATYKCGREFKIPIDEKFGRDSKEAAASWVDVQYEFLFFFTHLTMRAALSKLGNEKRIKLQKILGPVLVNLTTEAWFDQCPPLLKKEIKNNFYSNINVAELEYSKCNKLLPEKNESPKNTLLWELGRNVTRLSGYESNPEVIMLCVEITNKCFVEIDLEDLVDQVSEEI